MSEREVIDFCKALSDETRIRIIKLLSKGDLCVCHLVKQLDLAQPRVSRHLHILRGADLVFDRRDGQLVYYSLNRDKFHHWQEIIGEIIEKKHD